MRANYCRICIVETRRVAWFDVFFWCLRSPARRRQKFVISEIERHLDDRSDDEFH